LFFNEKNDTLILYYTKAVREVKRLLIEEGNMARFVRDLVINQPDDFVHFIMNDYLQKNQFIMADWKGEPAYRAGDAMLEGYKYLKWFYSNGALHLEAWIKGTAGGEWDLDGFVGCMAKKPYKESLEQLFVTLQQPVPVSQGMQNPQGAQGVPNPQPIPVHTVDNTKAATMALTFGILSLVFCWIPIVSIIFACLGISRARMGSGSSKASQAKTGKILCIVGLVLAIVLWIANIALLYI